MLVNLNRELSESERLELQLRHLKILDFTGTFKCDVGNDRILQAREIDFDHSIERRSIENYVNAIGELGQSNLRDICIKGDPVWWLIPMSEKHDSYHWGQIVFFFLTFFELKKDLFVDEIEILLPFKANPGLDEFILLNLKNSNGFSVSFSGICHERHSLRKLFDRFFKSIVKYFFFKIKTRSVRGKQPLKKDVVVVPITEYILNGGSNLNIKWVEGYLNEMKAVDSFDYIPNPIFSLLKKLVPSSLNDTALNNFIQYSPSFFRVLSYLIGLFKLAISIKLKVKGSIQTTDYLFNRKLLCSEIVEGIYKADLYLSKMWFESYFKQNPNHNVIYSDEFYSSGRAISSALAKLKNTKTIGVQHGIITNNHTVYRYTTSDFSGDNSIPIPNIFYVWNDIFKNIIGNRNIPLLKIIETVNDFNFRSMKKLVALEKSSQDTSGKVFSILWATTLWSHFQREFEVIKSIFGYPNFEITIRLHPKGHITKNQVNELVGENSFKFSTNEYAADLSRTNLVLTNTFSTVYYDCYQLGINCMRIENNGSFCDFELNSRNIFSISNEIQFRAILKSIYNK